MSEPATAEPAAPAAEPTAAEPAALPATTTADRVAAFFPKGVPQPDATPAPAADPTPTEPTPAAEPEPTAEPEPVVEPAAEPAPEPEEVVDGPDLPTDDIGNEPEAEEEIELPEGVDEKAGAAFKAVKTELKSAKAEKAEADAQLAQAQARLEEVSAEAKEIDTFKAKIEELEREVGTVRIQKTEEYQNTIEKPLQSVVDEVQTLATKYELDPTELSNAVSTTDESKQDEVFETLLGSMSDRDKMKVYRQAEILRDVVAKETKLLANQDAALKELETRAEERKQQELVQRSEARKTAVSAVSTKLGKQVPELKDLGLDDITTEVADLDFGSLDPNLQSYHVLSGKLAPKLISQIRALNKKLGEQSDELAAFKKAGPSVGNTPAVVSDAAPISTAERMRQAGLAHLA